MAHIKQNKIKGLREAGLKITGPRIKILEILEQARLVSAQGQHHLSAEEIQRRLHEANLDIGFGTVYRVLTQFEQAGIVNRLHFENELAVFELNLGTHHDHLICDQCGHVEEFVDPLIEERQAAIAVKSGFQMTEHSLNIYGICARCQQKSK